MRKLFGLCFIAAMLVTLAACTAVPAEKQPVAYVQSVTIKYNGETVKNGMLELDLSSEGHKLSADVKVTGEISTAVVYSSSNNDVAEIAENGALTLKGDGETVLTATSAADAEFADNILLTVSDTQNVEELYTVTVVSGKANVEKAAAGTIVTISADKLEGRTFTGWTFDKENLWINGNIFEMPASDVTVTAHHDTLSYGLEAENAVCTVNGEAVGEKIPYGTEVSVEPSPAPVGKEFTGWECGDLVIEDNVFTMPAYDVSITAKYDFIDYEINVTGGTYSGTSHYGETILVTPDEYIAADGRIFIGWKGVDGADGVSYGTLPFEMPASDLAITPLFARAESAAPSKTIDEGANTAQRAVGKDVVIDGKSGISYPIAADKTKGYMFRIRGGGITCDVDKVAAVTLTNDSVYAVTLEFIYEFQGDTTRTTGVITVPANGSVTRSILVKSIPKADAPYGETPFVQVILNGNIGGNSSETVNLGVQICVAKAEENTALPRMLTVNGGSYTFTNNYIGNALYAGDTVILTPEEKSGYRFTGWQCSDASVEIKNNSFTMPDKNITVTAQYEEIIGNYTITVQNGSYDGEPNEGETIALKLNDNVAPAGKMLIGWKGIEEDSEKVSYACNNFVMPARNLIITPVFGDAVSAPLTASTDWGSYLQPGPSGKATTINGISGYEYAIDATKTKDSLLRIRGGGITSDADKVVEFALKNTGSYSITFEFFIEFTEKDDAGNDVKLTLATTGKVTLAPNETRSMYLLMKEYTVQTGNGAGTHPTPYPCIKIHNDIGGNSGETVGLAVCVRSSAIGTV